MENLRTAVSRSLHDALPIYLLESSSHRGGKGNGLRWVLDRLGLEAEKAVAFGNADNDIDMMRLAGIGVAVADATES